MLLSGQQVVEVLEGCVRRVHRVHVVRPVDAIHGSRNGLEVPEHPRDVGLLAHCELLGDRPQRGDHHLARALLVSLREIDLLDRRRRGLDGPRCFGVAGDGPRGDRTGGDQVREGAIADRRREHPGSGLGLETPSSLRRGDPRSRAPSCDALSDPTTAPGLRPGGLPEIRERPRVVMESCPGLRAPTSDWWANAAARAHRRVPLSSTFLRPVAGEGPGSVNCREIQQVTAVGVLRSLRGPAT